MISKYIKINRLAKGWKEMMNTKKKIMNSFNVF